MSTVCKLNADLKCSGLDSFKRVEGTVKQGFPQYFVIHRLDKIQSQSKNETQQGAFTSNCISPPQITQEWASQWPVNKTFFAMCLIYSKYIRDVLTSVPALATSEFAFSLRTNLQWHGPHPGKYHMQSM